MSNNDHHWPTPVNRIINLRPNAPVKQLEMVVLRIYPQRLVVSQHYTGPVAAACGRDDTGVVGLVLWGGQVNNVRVGDIIRVESGWCRLREQALVVSTGRTGRMSIVSRFGSHSQRSSFTQP